MAEMWKMIPSHNQGLQSNHLWSHCSFLCSSTVADVAQRDRGDVLSNFIRWHHCPGLQGSCWMADTESSTLPLAVHSWASGWHLSSQRQIRSWAPGEAGGVTSQGKKVSRLARSGNWDAPRVERQAGASFRCVIVPLLTAKMPCFTTKWPRNATCLVDFIPSHSGDSIFVVDNCRESPQHMPLVLSSFVVDNTFRNITLDLLSI